MYGSNMRKIKLGWQWCLFFLASIIVAGCETSKTQTGSTTDEDVFTQRRLALVESDIEGAEFGTDDRQFSLRAERSGGEGGRVYTITYRARDAAGNTATATATVTVPHDRR